MLVNNKGWRYVFRNLVSQEYFGFENKSFFELFLNLCIPANYLRILCILVRFIIIQTQLKRKLYYRSSKVSSRCIGIFDAHWLWKIIFLIPICRYFSALLNAKSILYMIYVMKQYLFSSNFVFWNNNNGSVIFITYKIIFWFRTSYFLIPIQQIQLHLLYYLRFWHSTIWRFDARLFWTMHSPE